MVQNLIIGISAFTENFILRLWEAGSDLPGAHVYETTLVEKDGSGVPTPGAGHQVEEVLSINGLDRVVHIMRIYGATSGNLLLGPANIQPLVNQLLVQMPVRFKIGDGGTNTPAAGQGVCITPEIAGLTTNQFIIHRANYGPLMPDIHFTLASGGEWDLVGLDVFNDDEEFTIEILPSIIQVAVNDSVVGKWFSDFVDVSADTNYSNSHLRKLIRFSGSPKYTFLVTDNVPIGYAFVFQHFGTAGTATIRFQNGTLLWAGSPKTSIDIPSYCQGAFVWDGTNWNCIYMVQSTWVNGAGAPVAGTTLGVGRFNVGDVAPGDPIYEIVHNLGIAGDYLFFYSLESNNSATYFRNNKVCGTWWHHATQKANRVLVSLQEISGEAQDLTIAWIIVKA
jgi:hypothetical protein